MERRRSDRAGGQAPEEGHVERELAGKLVPSREYHEWMEAGRPDLEGMRKRWRRETRERLAAAGGGGHPVQEAGG